MSESLPVEMCELIASGMSALGVPGMAVGVVDGEREGSACFGITSIENPLPVNADTLFQVGSITKTVTATMAMALVEAGKLSLDEPLRTYLPGLRLADEAVASVTMRHLLTHTGGWEGDYYNDFGSGDDALALMVAAVADLPQILPLGRYWSYNNAGFYLAGRALEVVAGKPYEALARALVLAPLGMETSFFTAADCITHRVACGHEAGFGPEAGPLRLVRPWAVPRCAAPMGGLVSTLSDMLRYARFHMGDGTPLLPATAVAAMQQPWVAAGADAACGMPWSIRDVGGTRIVRHDGGTRGQQATLVLAPRRRFALVALTNSHRGLELVEQVRRWALLRYLGVKEPAAQPIAATAAELAPYAGRYHLTVQDLLLTLEGDALLLHWLPRSGWPTPESLPPPPPPPARAALCGPDRLLVLDEPAQGATGDFLRHPDGSIGWLRFGGRAYVRIGRE